MVEAVRAMFDLGVILFTSFIGAAMFERLKLPPVIGMILAGIALNPFTPGFTVESGSEISLFAQLGGIMLMFVLGLQFEHHHMRRLGAGAFILAGAGSVATFFAGALAGVLMGFQAVEALIAGAFFVSTSTTIALKMMHEMGYDKFKKSRLMEAAIVIDDLYGFIVLGLVSAYIGVGGASGPDILLGSFAMVLATLVVFFAGVKVVPKVFEFFEQRFPSSALTFGTSFCLVLVYVLVSFNVSPFVSAFLAGTLLTSSIRYRDVLKAVLPIRNLFANVFFVSVGLLLDPLLLLSALPAIVAFSVVAVASKWIGASIALMKLGAARIEAVKLGMMTAPRGEVLLVIAESAVLAGTVPPVFLAFATGIVLLSAIAAPIASRLLPSS